MRSLERRGDTKSGETESTEKVEVEGETKVEKKEIPPEEIKGYTEEIKGYKARIRLIGSDIKENDLIAFKEEEYNKAVVQLDELKAEAKRNLRENYGMKEIPKDLEDAFLMRYNSIYGRRDRGRVRLNDFKATPPEIRGQMAPEERKGMEFEEKADELINIKHKIERDKYLTEEDRTELLKEIEQAKEELRNKVQSERKKAIEAEMRAWKEKVKEIGGEGKKEGEKE